MLRQDSGPVGRSYFAGLPLVTVNPSALLFQAATCIFQGRIASFQTLWTRLARFFHVHVLFMIGRARLQVAQHREKQKARHYQPTHSICGFSRCRHAVYANPLCQQALVKEAPLPPSLLAQLSLPHYPQVGCQIGQAADQDAALSVRTFSSLATKRGAKSHEVGWCGPNP